MTKRKIIEIDRDKCNGCGLCTEACAEGALMLDEEDKAVLMKEIYCDGMGACLDVCPTGALKIIERESDVYDPRAAYSHVLKTRGEEAARNVHGMQTDDAAKESRRGEEEKNSVSPLPCGCPGSMAREIDRKAPPQGGKFLSGSSELSQWPIQLHLVSPHAPYFDHSDLLIAADCTAFSLGSFHQDLLKGKKLIIACPKLDDIRGYVEKMAQIIKNNTIYSITVATMVVPCCSGLMQMAEKAVEMSGAGINIKRVVIGIDGEIIEEKGGQDHRAASGTSIS
jgi:NAD-dependent dihydropyrimidine dehydrogenase PreA subunit